MKKTYSILFVLICLFGLSAFAESSVSPLEKEEVLSFLSELNNQKIFLADEFSYPSAASSPVAPKYNRLNTFSEGNGFFISGSPLEYLVYKADVNNDGGEEYVLVSSGKTKKVSALMPYTKKYAENTLTFSLRSKNLCPPRSESGWKKNIRLRKWDSAYRE